TTETRLHFGSWLVQHVRNLLAKPDPKGDDLKRALVLAKEAVDLNPREESSWHILGVVHYRAGNWKDAVAALEQSLALGTGGPNDHELFLTMAYAPLGDKKQADSWFQKAVQEIEEQKDGLEKDPKHKQELNRIRAEAAAILGVKEEKK